MPSYIQIGMYEFKKNTVVKSVKQNTEYIYTYIDKIVS